ncbi:TetR/AcrR family transcriptional regulator [Microlunatus sp. GCM10028923]|uniref:TetR/AcrR family transcriptional regulator n=1 Tax=Microlunatus sp. GCM10028923 TaxID=3273400 RepID=UPI003612FCB2
MPDPALRANARRNRERLLAAAEEVVTERGTSASLRDIARRAEVGIGTLYRHFPTREALLEALMQERFERLQARADELLGEPPYRAVVTWLRDLAAASATVHGLPDAVLSALRDRDSALHAACDGMRTAGARLLERAQSAGAIRADLTPSDLLALTAGLAWASDYAEDKEARLERLFAVMETGLAS